MATLTSPPTRTRPAAERFVGEVLSAIGWEPDDLDPAYPPHVAFAGNDHLVLGVRHSRPSPTSTTTTTGWPS